MRGLRLGLCRSIGAFKRQAFNLLTEIRHQRLGDHGKRRLFTGHNETGHDAEFTGKGTPISNDIDLVAANLGQLFNSIPVHAIFRRLIGRKNLGATPPVCRRNGQFDVHHPEKVAIRNRLCILKKRYFQRDRGLC